jgi:diguanylate cyclase (GGDEF)-like protein
MPDAPTRRRPDSTRRLVFRVAQLCAAVRDILSARRVSVLLYNPSSRTVSPLVSDRPEDERLRELARKWSRIPLDSFPAARTVLLERKPVSIDDAERDVRLPSGMAANFGASSVHLEPLLTTEPIGILAIEPRTAASSPDFESIVPLVAASVARIQERRRDEPEAPAGESVLELVEAVAEERTLERALATICERLAVAVDARRAAVFLLEKDRVVPRMCRRADGGSDPQAWERFRTATTPLPLVETALDAGDAVQAEDAQSPLIAGWWSETFDIGSALAAPLGRHSSLVGVVVVEAGAPRAFDDDDARFLSEASARLGGIVGMTRAIEERTSNLEAATAIRRLLEEGSRAHSIEEAAEGLARVSRDALGTEDAAVFLADEEDRIRHVAVDGPEEFRALASERLVGAHTQDFRLWRRVTRQRRPIFVEDAAESQLIPAELVALLRLRSYVAYPLLSAERALGLVICSDTRDRRQWSDEDRELVDQLALEGSLVIENAGLRATDRQQIDELSRQAFHDSLTDLPNRSLFADRVSHALARTRRGNRAIAVLLLDLDGFKEINDNFGHEAGDKVLIAVAQRLRACLRPGDTIARLGGDEFTILLEDIASVSEATRVAERIESSLRTPFVVEGHETRVTTSIGIALNEPGHGDLSSLLRNADAAMYRAKHGGSGRYEVFSGEDVPPHRRVALEENDVSVKRRSITRERDGDHGAEDNGPLSGRTD